MSKTQRVESTAMETQTSKLDRHGFLFGQKITHSLSPYLHQVIYDRLGLSWSQIRLDSSDIQQFLQLTQDPSFYGASVTMPNKVNILSHLDEMTPECRDVGACNTLFLKDRSGKRILCGANTDVLGVWNSFQYNISDPEATFHGRPALVIGGGGAARSAIYALRKWMKVTDIYLVNRDKSEIDAMIADCSSRGFGHGLRHIETVEQAQFAEGPGAIVACIPDTDPSTKEEIQAREVSNTFLRKAHKGAMLEMCYNPTPFTKLGAIAEDEGWKVILGTEALIWQGLEQDKYWTGLDINQLPVRDVQDAIREKVTQKLQSKL